MELALTKLDRAHSAKLAKHYARLDPSSARLRFCAPITPEAASRHADRIDWTHGAVVGAFGPDGEIRAVCEILADPSGNGAELALSVEAPWRAKGVGTAVSRAALLEAGKLGVVRAIASCLPENRGMQRIAEKLNGRVTARDMDGVETEIRISGGPTVDAFGAAA